MRQTSLEALKEISASGVLGELQLLAWVSLQHKGPMTGRELDDYAGKAGLWKRLSELKKLGLVAEDGVRPCNVSGMKSLVWRAVVSKAQRPEREPKPRTFWLLSADGKDGWPKEWISVFFDKKRAQVCATKHTEIIEVREVRRKGAKKK